MRELLIKIVSNLGMKGISVLLALSMHVMLARWLTPSEYGQFALMQVIAMGLATFAQAGMQNTYMKLVVELKELYGIYALTKTCLRLILLHLIIAIAVFLSLAIAFYLLGKIENVLVLLAFGIYMIFQSFMMVVLAWYRAINKAYMASFVEQGSFAGLTVVFGLIWLVMNETPWSLQHAAMGFAISIALVFCIALWPVYKQITNHRQDDYSPDLIRILQLSRRFLTMQMASYVTNWSGVIIVGLFLAADQVAELNVAQRLAQIVVFFLMAFNGVIAPRFAKLNAVEDFDALRRLAQRAANILTMATLPVVLIAAIWGKQLLKVFGDEYISAYPLLLIIMLGQLVNALTGSVGFLLNMTNHEHIMRNIVLTSSLITVVVSIFGTYFFGVVGAACAITLGLIMNNLTAAYFVFKYLGFVTIPGLQWIKKYAY